MSTDGTFIGHRDGEWGFFIDNKWEIISVRVEDCIEVAESMGYRVNYTKDGDTVQINSVTKTDT